MTIPAGPKIDCHVHVLDPARFPYADDTPYRPEGQEVAPAAHLIRVLDAFDVRHALIVGTNSGYGTDSRILLDALRLGQGRFKGVAVVENDVGIHELERLKAAGIVGVAFNVPFYKAGYYRDSAALLEKLVELGLFLQVQVENDQLLTLLPLIEKSQVRLVIDHCGRPSVAAGLKQSGFQALLAIGRERDAWIKLSGAYKFSQQSHPYEDTWPFIAALVEAFTIADVSGARTGRSCARRSGWIMARCSRRCRFCFPTPATGSGCCGVRRRGCLALRTTQQINRDRQQKTGGRTS